MPYCPEYAAPREFKRVEKAFNWVFKIIFKDQDTILGEDLEVFIRNFTEYSCNNKEMSNYQKSFYIKQINKLDELYELYQEIFINNSYNSSPPTQYYKHLNRDKMVNKVRNVTNSNSRFMIGIHNEILTCGISMPIEKYLLFKLKTRKTIKLDTKILDLNINYSYTYFEQPTFFDLLVVTTVTDKSITDTHTMYTLIQSGIIYMCDVFECFYNRTSEISNIELLEDWDEVINHFSELALNFYTLELTDSQLTKIRRLVDNHQERVTFVPLCNQIEKSQSKKEENKLLTEYQKRLIILAMTDTLVDFFNTFLGGGRHMDNGFKQSRLSAFNMVRYLFYFIEHMPDKFKEIYIKNLIDECMEAGSVSVGDYNRITTSISCTTGLMERVFMTMNTTLNIITVDGYDQLSNEEEIKLKRKFMVDNKKLFFGKTVIEFYKIHVRKEEEHVKKEEKKKEEEKEIFKHYTNIDDLIEEVILHISNAINTCTWDESLIKYKDKRVDWKNDWPLWIDKYNLCDDAILYYELMLDDSVLSAPGYKLPLDRPEHLETQNEYLNTLLQDIDEFVEINAEADAEHMAAEHPNNGNQNNGNRNNGNGNNGNGNNGNNGNNANGGSFKKYITLKSGGRRLIRHTNNRSYYILNKKRKYIK